ncbi:integrase core domain-containing protein [Micromonospora sp. NPDC005173]|uniref:integrase core domain-containing protein n=1 Tax=Micromonospora sp. NPDC005173 TaxID=3157165 RepID=UPI0033B2AEB6
MFTIPRECTDRMLIVGERHLAAVLAEYTAHYNSHRPHRSLDQRPPNPAPHVVDLNGVRIQRRPILGGLINEYSQAAWPDRLYEPHRLMAGQGWQGAFLAEHLSDNGILPSMGSVGDSYGLHEVSGGQGVSDA